MLKDRQGPEVRSPTLRALRHDLLLHINRRLASASGASCSAECSQGRAVLHFLLAKPHRSSASSACGVELEAPVAVVAGMGSQVCWPSQMSDLDILVGMGGRECECVPEETHRTGRVRSQQPRDSLRQAAQVVAAEPEAAGARCRRASHAAARPSSGRQLDGQVIDVALAEQQAGFTVLSRPYHQCSSGRRQASA